jgi:DnaJ-class molecular chaperone
VDDDPLKIKIPSGSMPGDTITVKGRGFPNSRRRGKRGDVTIVLRLKSPPRLSRAAKKALEDLRSHIDDGANPEDSARDEAKRRRK